MRSVSAILLIALVGGSAHAGSLPRQIGMYPAQTTQSLPMLDSTIDVAVRGPIVETTVTQTYKNDSDHAIEATYIFPLPVDAAVSAMSIDTGTRKIHASIERRDQAQQRYEDAVAAGVGAGLLEQERPDVFTQTVSAIPPHGTVAITLRFDATARYADGTWELVLPLVVAPRYVPGTVNGRPTTGSGRSPDTDRSHDASRVTPHSAPGAGGKTAISIAFQTAVENVTSPTHDIHHAKTTYTIEDAKSDHDAIVRWRAKAPASGWVEADGGAGFAAVVVEVPPAPAKRTDAAKCTFIIDRAATTHGDGDLVERALVRALLGTMTAKDRIAAQGITLRAPVDMQRALDEAWAKPGGVFNLTKTLADARNNDSAIVLVSDGLVADDAAAIAAAKRTGVQIHVIGFGPAPNRGLLTAIANATGGTIRFAIVGDDLDALARDVVGDLASAPAPLTVSWGTLAASDVVPATLPRIGAGQAALVLARVKHAQAANARARGELFSIVSTTSPTATGSTSTHGTLGRRWARLKLDGLIAAGNARAITDHALANGLVSPYTAMVAIGDEVIVEGGVKHTKAVPVSVPAGMRWQEVKRETTLDFAQKNTVLTPTEDQRRHEEKPEDAKKSPPKDPNADHTKAPKKDDADEPRHKKSKHADDSEGERDDVDRDSDGDDDGGKAAKKTKKAGEKYRNAKRPAPPAGAASGESVSQGDVTTSTGAAPEPMDAPKVMASRGFESGMDESEVDGTVVSEYSSRGRIYRLAASLGGGVAIINREARGLATVAGRFDVAITNRTYGGFEAALSVVPSHGLEGSVLATIARRGFLVPRLELGAGFGVRFGDAGAGPAIDLVLRIHTPLRHVALFLRYDGALLLHDTTRDGENTQTFGLEAGF